MQLSVIIMAAVVVVAQAVKKETLLQPRLLSSAMRINRMEHEIEELKHDIEEAGKIDPLAFVSEMHARLDQVEESNCLPRQVQCGWRSFDCVSDLVVCDGHRDCYNGWDESEEVCSHGPIVAGNVFGGTVAWRSCRPLRETYETLKITGVMTSKLYPARLGVTAHVIADVPQENTQIEGDMVGTYIYGKKRLVLVPDSHTPGNLFLSVVCDFNHVGDERADCRLVSQASLHKCAEVHYTLKHGDAHHTRHHGTDHHHHDDRGDDHRGEIVEHHYDIEGHDHAEHFDKDHHRIDHEDDDH